LAAVVLALAGLGWRYWMQSMVPEPITLAVLEHDGQLRVEWNHSAKLVREALRGSLELSDGGESKTIALSKEMLASGNFTYVRKSGDVEVRMTVETPDGARWQEASRYLGRPPASGSGTPSPIGTQPLPGEADAEVTRLHQENSRQRQRIQQLELQLKLLQLHGDGAKEP
jgi:hypothetical protein